MKLLKWEYRFLPMGFCKNLSDSLKKIEWFAHLLFRAEQPERIAHICSLVMSDLSDWLTVAHLSWATGAIQSQSPICPEPPERFAHSCSFVLSELLTFAHFSWVTWANRSHSLICIERFEQMSKWVNERWANERWANERIPSPGYNSTLRSFRSEKRGLLTVLYFVTRRSRRNKVEAHQIRINYTVCMYTECIAMAGYKDRLYCTIEYTIHGRRIDKIR